MKKRIVMLSMLSVFTLAACGGNGGAAAKINIELLDVEDLTAETGRKVTDSACQGEKNLLIDADVELGDMGRLFEITVKSDVELRKRRTITFVLYSGE